MIRINISTPPIIAKTLAVSGFAASVFLVAAPAHAISFNFEFQDVVTKDFVKGTLDGLVEGNNLGPEITATVTSSPNGQGLGSYYFMGLSGNSDGSKAFTVTNGNVTFADTYFQSISSFPGIDNVLFLGKLNNGWGTSSLFNAPITTYSFTDTVDNSTTKFTAAAPVPFESSPIALPASLAVCFGAAKLLRNHLAKKRMVSVEA